MRVLEREIHGLRGFYDRLIAFVADGQLGQARAEGGARQRRSLRPVHEDSTLMQNDIARLVQDTRTSRRVPMTAPSARSSTAGLLALVIAAWLLMKVPERLRVLYAAEEDARLDAEQDANSARALAHVSDAVLLIDDSGLDQVVEQRGGVAPWREPRDGDRTACAGGRPGVRAARRGRPPARRIRAGRSSRGTSAGLRPR